MTGNLSETEWTIYAILIGWLLILFIVPAIGTALALSFILLYGFMRAVGAV